MDEQMKSLSLRVQEMIDAKRALNEVSAKRVFKDDEVCRRGIGAALRLVESELHILSVKQQKLQNRTRLAATDEP